MMMQRLSRNQVRLLGECEDVDQAGAVREHLGQGVLPQARLHELAARQETSASRVHLSENLLCSRSRNLPRLLQGRSFSGSRCHHLEYSSCYLGHLLRLYHPVVVNVKQPKGPGQLLLLIIIVSHLFMNQIYHKYIIYRKCNNLAPISDDM